MNKEELRQQFEKEFNKPNNTVYDGIEKYNLINYAHWLETKLLKPISDEEIEKVKIKYENEILEKVGMFIGKLNRDDINGLHFRLEEWQSKYKKLKHLKEQ